MKIISICTPILMFHLLSWWVYVLIVSTD